MCLDLQCQNLYLNDTTVMKNQLQFLLALGVIAALFGSDTAAIDTTLIDCENGCNAGAGVTDADGSILSLNTNGQTYMSTKIIAMQNSPSSITSKAITTPTEGIQLFKT
jgi:hypothetical protein